MSLSTKLKRFSFRLPQGAEGMLSFFLIICDMFLLDYIFKETFNLWLSGKGPVELYLSSYNHGIEETAVNEFARSGIVIDSYKSTQIKGHVKSDKDGMLFFTIPYDKGWSVYIDGNKVDTYKTLTSFTGTDISAGEHQVELKYMPSGFVLGIIISIISWLVFVIVCFIVTRLLIIDKNDTTKEEQDK